MRETRILYDTNGGQWASWHTLIEGMNISWAEILSWSKKVRKWKIRWRPFLKWVLRECDIYRTLSLKYGEKQNEKITWIECVIQWKRLNQLSSNCNRTLNCGRYFRSPLDLKVSMLTAKIFFSGYNDFNRQSLDPMLGSASNNQPRNNFNYFTPNMVPSIPDPRAQNMMYQQPQVFSKSFSN